MKVGFLPLYIKLYDDVSASDRPRMEAIYEKAAVEIEKRGVEVVRSPFCRLKAEFKEAVNMFERENVDAIITLHLAYSPSLESIEALTDTDLPIVVLDTTEVYEFTNEQSPDEVMFCHGVHGVMDMCNMLGRYGKEYAIAAGHLTESDCVDRACGYVRAAIAAKALTSAKVGLIGSSFDGMGDFRVPFGEMKTRFGIEVLEPTTETMLSYVNNLTDEEIAAEKAANSAAYDFSDNIVESEYDEAVRSCLAVRKFVKDNALSAFSVNFLKIGPSNAGISSMPFLEACKSMQNGVGYAGEGDSLTAAFVGALLQGYKNTTFVEVFCPDWKNNMLFLSHMGEMNYNIAGSKPCVTRTNNKYGTEDVTPYAGYARMKGGKGVYVNISRSYDDFRLFIAPAEMVDYDHDNFPKAMRGWMRPESCTTASFLEEHSRYGATHHSIFVYGATAEEIEYFGQLLGVETIIV